MSLDLLVETLKKDEGSEITNGRHRLYKCPAGKWTIGYGRNLEDNGASEDEVTDWLMTDARIAMRDAASLVPSRWGTLDDVRKNVLANMAYNLGKKRLSGFVKMLAAVNEGRFDDAAVEMLNSAWRTQVGQRAVRLSDEMQTGVAS